MYLQSEACVNAREGVVEYGDIDGSAEKHAHKLRKESLSLFAVGPIDEYFIA